jgi:DNA-binding MarR family transcriptional regulator
MGREEKLKKVLGEQIDQKRRPSIELLSEELGWPVQDVHRIVNSLEKKKEVESYSKEVLDRKIRMVSLKR